jgi:DNA-directed RNA polymerase specialized sigma24 family protein
MPSDLAPEHSPTRDFRFFTEDAFVRRPGDAPGTERLDVDELVGAKGERRQPTEDDWRAWRDFGRSSIYEPNALIVSEVANLYEEDEDDPGARRAFQYGAARILSRLALRLAPVAADAFRDCLDQLIEPVRTVSISCLILGIDHETVAGRLGTSVETIDFLVEVALSHLEPLVEIRSPRRHHQSLVYSMEQPDLHLDDD